MSCISACPSNAMCDGVCLKYINKSNKMLQKRKTYCNLFFLLTVYMYMSPL